MVKQEATKSHIGHWRTSANGNLTVDANGDEKTDYLRWRLLDDRGRQTWHYLESDEENEKWSQTIADRHHIGLPTVFLAFPVASNCQINVPD
jgi:lanosterol synthase